MYIAIIKDGELVNDLLELKSENRNYMRSLQLLCEENGLPCEITEERAPRPVKFKGVE